MENYFAKFLCKPRGRAPVEGHHFVVATPPTHTAQPGRDANGSLCFPSEAPINIPLPSSSKGAPHAHEITVHPSSIVQSDEEEDYLIKRSTVHSPTSECVVVDEAPCEDEDTDALESPLQRRRVEVVVDDMAPSPFHDDDDDLLLLLGSQEARRQAQERHEKTQKIAQHADSVGTSAAIAYNSARSTDFPTQLSRLEPISSLPWKSQNRRDLRWIAKLFSFQLETEIALNPSLFAALSPFLRERFADKVGRSLSLYSPNSGSVAASLPDPLQLPHDSWDEDADDEEVNPYHRVIPPFKLFAPAPSRVTAEMTTPPAGSGGAGSVYTLREYQLDGVTFLLHHFHRGLSCILSDDMGLGKTAQICSFLHVLSGLHGISGPHLVICPLTTLTNWMRELGRWAPELRLTKYHGGREERQKHRHTAHSSGVVVTTPALLNQDKSFFLKRSWVTVIVDEAHVLKNQTSRVTSISRKLTSAFRIAVTGTPIQNDTREVWSILGFLFPQLISRDGAFDCDDPAEAAAACATILSHVMLRRTKGQLLLGIPPRVDHPVTLLEPTAGQHEVLSLLTNRALDSDGGSMQIHLTHQRMVCSHPLALQITSSDGRSSGTGAGGAAPITERLKACGISISEKDLIQPSAKMRYLDEVLPRLRAEGHRCLIFTNFTSVVDLLEGMCLLRGYSYERLDGSCNRVERELSLLRFNNAASSCFLFLITTSAGGVGITLTGADTVILFDANFNPQLDRQAADRAHRIGQTREVHVYRLCLRNTLEEYIREISEYKASLGDIIVNAGSETSRGVESPAVSPVSPSRSSSDFSLSAQEIRSMAQRLQSLRQERLEAASSGAECNNSSSALGATVCVDDDKHDNTSEQEKEELVRRVLHALERRDAAPSAQKGHSGFPGSSMKSNNYCFVCGDKMRKLEGLYRCIVCPKSYHADCVGEKPPKPGSSAPRQWSCPRHRCVACSKAMQADGAIFMCHSCPRSFCFDCLPAHFLELDDSGEVLRHISKTYEGMREEETEERRSNYYIRCLRCCGLEDPTSSSESEDDSDDSSNSE